MQKNYGMLSLNVVGIKRNELAFLQTVLKKTVFVVLNCRLLL